MRGLENVPERAAGEKGVRQMLAQQLRHRAGESKPGGVQLFHLIGGKDDVALGARL